MNSKITFLLLLSIVSSTSIAQLNGILDINSKGHETTSFNAYCDTISSFPVMDTWPTGTAWDGQYLWSCGSDFSLIYKYDTTGVLIGSIPNPSFSYGTQGLVFDGINLWALAEQQDIIYQLDTSNGAILSQFSIPSSTNWWGLTFDGSNLYSTNYIDSRIIKIDPLNGQIIDSIYAQKPILGIEYINGSFYGISADFKNLYKIDLTNGNFTDSISWCIPYPLGITWSGSYLWNISSSISFLGTQCIYKIDISTLLTATNNIQSQNGFDITILPNPINERGIIKINAIDPGFVTIELFNSNARKVKTIVNNRKLNNYDKLVFDTDGLPSGIYFLRLSSMKNIDTFKFIISKK